MVGPGLTQLPGQPGVAVSELGGHVADGDAGGYCVSGQAKWETVVDPLLRLRRRQAGAHSFAPPRQVGPGKPFGTVEALPAGEPLPPLSACPDVRSRARSSRVTITAPTAKNAQAAPPA